MVQYIVSVPVQYIVSVRFNTDVAKRDLRATPAAPRKPRQMQVGRKHLALRKEQCRELEKGIRDSCVLVIPSLINRADPFPSLFRARGVLSLPEPVPASFLGATSLVDRSF